MAESQNVEYKVSWRDEYSEYVTSDAVASKQRPNPPTLRFPVSGSAISLDAGSITFSWQHNARDGSSQEEAQLRYDFITSGNIESATDSELKVTGSFDFEG